MEEPSAGAVALLGLLVAAGLVVLYTQVPPPAPPVPPGQDGDGQPPDGDQDGYPWPSFKPCPGGPRRFRS